MHRFAKLTSCAAGGGAADGGDTSPLPPSSPPLGRNATTQNATRARASARTRSSRSPPYPLPPNLSASPALIAFHFSLRVGEGPHGREERGAWGGRPPHPLALWGQLTRTGAPPPPCPSEPPLLVQMTVLGPVRFQAFLATVKRVLIQAQPEADAALDRLREFTAKRERQPHPPPPRARPAPVPPLLAAGR